MNGVKNILFFFLLASILAACGGTKKLEKKDSGSLSAAQRYMHRIESAQDSFHTLQLDGKIDLNSDIFSGRGSFKLRMRRDSVIWIRVSKFGFEIARISISRDSFTLINRLRQECVKGPVRAFARKLTHLPIDYNFLQNLIMGEIPIAYALIPPIHLNGDTLRVSMRPQGMNGRLEVTYHNPQVKPLAIKGKVGNEGNDLSIVNGAFTEKAGIQSFPLRRIYFYEDRGNRYRVEMDISTMQVDRKLNFPMQIPSHYKIVYP